MHLPTWKKQGFFDNQHHKRNTSVTIVNKKMRTNFFLLNLSQADLKNQEYDKP